MAGRTRTNLGLKLDIINRYHGVPHLHTHLLNSPSSSNQPRTQRGEKIFWFGWYWGRYGEEGGGETNEVWRLFTPCSLSWRPGREGVTGTPPEVHFLPTKVLKASLVTGPLWWRWVTGPNTPHHTTVKALPGLSCCNMNHHHRENWLMEIKSLDNECYSECRILLLSGPGLGWLI